MSLKIITHSQDLKHFSDYI